MRYYLPLLFLLSGCTPIFLNEPDLASPPSDDAKYHADLKVCEEAQRATVMETLTGGMGAIPVSGVMIAEGKSNDMFKSTYTKRDECMQHKGYVLK